MIKRLNVIFLRAWYFTIVIVFLALIALAFPIWLLLWIITGNDYLSTIANDFTLKMLDKFVNL